MNTAKRSHCEHEQTEENERRITKVAKIQKRQPCTSSDCLSNDVWRLLFEFLNKPSIFQLGYTNKYYENLVFREMPHLFEIIKIPRTISHDGLVSFFARVNAKETVRYLILSGCRQINPTDALLGLGSSCVLEGVEIWDFSFGSQTYQSLEPVLRSMIKDQRLWNLRISNQRHYRCFFHDLVREGVQKKERLDGFECKVCGTRHFNQYRCIVCYGCSSQAFHGRPLKGFCEDHDGDQFGKTVCVSCFDNYCGDCRDKTKPVCSCVCDGWNA
mmetsp:Transcript_7442/g.17012  ORF Transcript_7442/g.17012 Transcript_7442/m.17012 type:complete len:271 (+) Transcript_7442:54-866(+)